MSIKKYIMQEIFINKKNNKESFNVNSEDQGYLNTDLLEKQDKLWWNIEDEGQLSVDIYRQDNELIVKAPIAGINPSDLEVYFDNDLLTIRGRREPHTAHKRVEYFYRECFWGGFSRSIILPIEVEKNAINAFLKDGILTITMPITSNKNSIDVTVLD